MTEYISKDKAKDIMCELCNKYYGDESCELIECDWMEDIDKESAIDVAHMNELTYMDCWHFIAPLIPTNTNEAIKIYVMVFQALNEADKRAKREGKTDDKD